MLRLRFAFLFCISTISVLLLQQTGIAQCNGVFFKTASAQKLSQKFLNHFYGNFGGSSRKDLLGIRISTGAFEPDALLYYEQTDAGFVTAPVVSNINNFGAISPFRTIGDISGDGKLDYISQFNTAPVTVITYINDGSGSFTPSAPTIFKNGADGYERVETTADVNGDSRDDLITITANSRGLGYRLSSTDGTFGPRISLLTNVAGLIPLDTNGDSKTDISAYVVPSYSGDPAYVIQLINQGNGIFVPDFANRVILNTIPLAAADLNGDDRPELVTAEYPNPGTLAPKFSVLMNSGSGVFTKTDISSPDLHYRYGSVIAEDFDGDGRKDVGMFNGVSHRIYANNGKGLSFSTTESKASYGLAYADDVDGDGRADFVQVRSSFLNLTFVLGAGYYASNVVAIQKNVCSRPGETKIVDFDGDGRTDVGFWRPSDGRWRWLARENGAIVEKTLNWGLGSFGDVQAPNDYDGDGKTDHAIYRKSTGTWWVKRSSDSGNTVFRFGLEEDEPVASDYDGDGRADFAVFRPSEGNWYLWLSGNDQFYAVHFGLAGDIPLPADYDGDGKSDVAVYRPSTGVWYYLKSGDDNFAAIQFGLPTDKPVPADYDNDGKTDIAVFRPSDGLWYILSTADFGVSYAQFGTNGDIPFSSGFQANWTEITIFRRNQSRFYFEIFGSSYYQDFYSWGSTSDERVISSTLRVE